MDRSDLCGCKGCRTCLICEQSFGFTITGTGGSKQKATGTGNNGKGENKGSFLLCPQCCNLAWLEEDDSIGRRHPDHNPINGRTSVRFDGVFIEPDFLTEAEETELLKGIDTLPWDRSQSGRRKQNFGPKCNFKKRKLKLGNFDGFPECTRFVQERFNKQIPLLKDFQTIEQCSLEYDPERGASIDPHVDDCWIWGERIVTVNLLSDSVLTMTFNNEKRDKYNLGCVAEYPSRVEGPGCGKPFPIEQHDERRGDYPVVRIPMPRRSLLVMYGSARYEWEHRILRDDITERRVCLAYREFTPPYLPGGEHHEEAREILLRAKRFWN